MSAGAQERFTTQVVIVPVFAGKERRLANTAGDIVRRRLAGAFPKAELRVVSEGDMEGWMRELGFERDDILNDAELRVMARYFRADERVTGTVMRVGGKVRVEATIAAVRDLRLAQPLVAEGASVAEAAEKLASEVIAARRQFAPVRRCENAMREARPADAVTAVSQAIATYAAAVPARLCLISALTAQAATADTIASVATAALKYAPTNPLALEQLAMALDAQGKSAESAPIWVRLLATDTTSEALIERVVNELARGGNAAVAQPLIDQGSERFPDNLSLLRLRWLVHLATNDWNGATAAGERLLARDSVSQADPDFHARLATAFRSDSQPTRALSIAAGAAARFPRDAAVHVVYLQLLRAENEAALPRALAAFPESAELQVIAAQAYKGSGNTAGALEAMRRALAANPRLPHGYLQLAQLEFDAGNVDRAYGAIEAASQHGESPATVAQFALARGNDLYKAAIASQKRDDFQRAVTFLSLAAKLSPTAEAKFLLGASSLSISESAATEAPVTKSCDLSKLAEASLTEAEINLIGGGSVAPDAAKQYLDYVTKLRPYVEEQIKTFCSGN